MPQQSQFDAEAWRILEALLPLNPCGMDQEVEICWQRRWQQQQQNTNTKKQDM